MINIQDKYLIEVDDLNYTVYINKPRQRIKDGKEYTLYPVVGYYGSLGNALFAIRGRLIRDGLKNLDGPLQNAIDRVQEINAEFEEVMKGVKE